MTGCLGAYALNIFLVICLAFFWFNHDQIFSRSCIQFIFWPHYSGNRHSLYRLDTARTSIMMVQPVLGVFYWLPWVLLPRESWFWVVPPHSMPWLYWFPYRVFDAVRVKYRKGMYSVIIVTSVRYCERRILRSFEEIWDAAAKRRRSAT